MAEYLTPGVFVEVTSNRDDLINGASTDTAGFIGSCAFGPASGDPVLIGSIRDYQAVFGDGNSLEFDDREVYDYMSHAVQLFFANGGRKLYITRVFEPLAGKTIEESRACSAHLSHSATRARFRARYPGRLGNLEIRVHASRSENLVIVEEQEYRVRNLSPGDLIEIRGGPAQSGTVAPGSLAREQLYCVLADESGDLSLYDRDGEPLGIDLQQVALHRITIDMEFSINGNPASKHIELSTHPVAKRFLGEVFYSQSRDALDAHRLDTPPIEFAWSPPEDHAACLSLAVDLLLELVDLPNRKLVLRNGNDGALPGIDTYRGEEDMEEPRGLEAMRRASEMSVIAAPCLAALPDRTEQDGIRQLLAEYCDRRASCFAVLSGPLDGGLEDICDTRKKLDGNFAALYYPSLVADTPDGQISLPPDGAIAGVYVANQVNKAPLNLVIQGIAGVSSKLEKPQVELLASEQINCILDLHQTGIRILGARSLSSRPICKRVTNCRILIYIKESIARIIVDSAFRPDTASMRAALNARIQSFLNRQYAAGILTSDESFEVKCELENDRALCEIGILLEGIRETLVITLPA